MDDRMQDIGDAKPRMSKRRRFIVVGRWALAAAEQDSVAQIWRGD